MTVRTMYANPSAQAGLWSLPNSFAVPNLLATGQFSYKTYSGAVWNSWIVARDQNTSGSQSITGHARAILIHHQSQAQRLSRWRAPQTYDAARFTPTLDATVSESLWGLTTPISSAAAAGGATEYEIALDAGVLALVAGTLGLGGALPVPLGPGVLPIAPGTLRARASRLIGLGAGGLALPEGGPLLLRQALAALLGPGSVSLAAGSDLGVYANVVEILGTGTLDLTPGTLGIVPVSPISLGAGTISLNPGGALGLAAALVTSLEAGSVSIGAGGALGVGRYIRWELERGVVPLVERELGMRVGRVVVLATGTVALASGALGVPVLTAVVLGSGTVLIVPGILRLGGEARFAVLEGVVALSPLVTITSLEALVTAANRSPAVGVDSRNATITLQTLAP